MRLDDRLGRPWALLPNRVSRFYRGGLLLDGFRGAAAPADTNEPEDWVGSATRAWTPPDTVSTEEGLGSADFGGGERQLIADILEANPEAVAGVDLVARAGPTLGVLVKLLDAGIRLPVHAHPTRAFARHNLGSFFGKAEAWIVLGTREVPGEPEPGIRLGFSRPVGRDELRRWIEDENSDELLEALNNRPTAAGDVWFVPPGTPHAIGAGVFILEVQEPSDFSIVLETRGFPIDPRDAHLGLGWDVVLDAIDRAPMRPDDLVAGTWRDAVASNRLRQLLPTAAAPFFRADGVRVEGTCRPALDGAFVVGVAIAGSGTVRGPAGSLDVTTGSTFGLPAAAAPEVEFHSRDGLTLILCRGPRPEDLDREAPE